MKRFLGFVRKEFYHIFRDPRSMLVLFGMPVVQLLLFGFVLTNEVKDVNIAIYDKAADNRSRELTNKILSSGYFHLKQEIRNDAEIEDAFRSGEIKEVIVFEPGFASKLEREGQANIQLIADASDANMANLIVNYTSGIVHNYTRSLLPGGMQAGLININTRMVFNNNLKGVYMFIPGIMAMILLLISALMTSISIVKEKETGTMEVLLVSPLKPWQIVTGKVVPYMLLSFINAIVILLMGELVFGMPVRGSWVLLIAESMLFIFLALSLGILISTLTSNQQTAMMISLMALMLPTILLSGFIFPIENMPEVLQWLAQIMPPRWFITIVKTIMIKGGNLLMVWKETLVLMVMSAVFLGLAINKFKVRL